MKNITLSLSRWVNFLLNRTTHPPQPPFPGSGNFIPTEQEGRFEACPTLETPRAATADAPLPNDSLSYLQ